MKRHLPVLCPSSDLRVGSTLLGVVMEDGRVAFLPERVEVDEAFVKTANEGRDPRRRFRFSNACAQSRCMQWQDGRCDVIDAVMDATEAPALAHDDALPACSVRERCRWMLQRGPAACRVCPEVVTRFDAPAA